MNLKIFPASLLVLMLSACAGLQQTPMTPENHNKIKKVELYNLVVQDEVKPVSDLSNVSAALGGGLLAALFDASANKDKSRTAQEIIKPLYDATEDVDFRKLIAEGINLKVSAKFVLKNKKLVAETIMLSDSKISEKVKLLKPGESLLYISSFYKLRGNSTKLQTETKAHLYIGDGNNQTSDSKLKPDYFNHFIYDSEAVGSGLADSIDIWRRNNGEMFEQALIRSVDGIASMLMYDLQPDLNEKCFEIVKATSFDPGERLQNFNLTGYLVEHSNNRAVVRVKNSRNLYSIPTEALQENYRNAVSRQCSA